MSTAKINPVYSKVTKTSGSTLSASEWNALSDAANVAQTKVNSLIDDMQEAGGGGLPNVYVNQKGNLNIETSLELGNTSKGKINIEAINDIQIKPGDDITLYSHHREPGKHREVSMKVMNGSELSVDETTELGDYPVDLQLNVANITITTKDKSTYISEENKERQASGKGETSDAAHILNVNVNSGKNTRGYLKVRASAIDLRSETHGGIALQPKGNDGASPSPHENKIKFEHGGGDGLEFGTFNTEKTSIFTGEYRFKKDGVIKLATRTPVARATDGSDTKYDPNDPTTHYYYQKQADDFYDEIAQGDPTCTWEDLVRFVAWAKSTGFGPFASSSE